MRRPTGWPGTMLRVLLAGSVALALATPAAAQLGGLKKKLKQAEGATAAADDPRSAAPSAPAGPAAPAAAGGGAIVLTDDVVNRLVSGMKAGEAEREAAKKENTPYGKYHQAVAAYEVAKPKCDAAHQAFPQRMMADQKLADRYQAMADKMAAQMGKDMKKYEAYGDSALAIIDPSCTVKQPQQPDNYSDMQRDVDNRAEQKTLKTAGFDGTMYGAVVDRTYQILTDAPPPDASSSEKSAVNKRADELNRLLGLKQAPEPRNAKPAPSEAAAPAAPAAPAVAAPSGMQDCMAKNAQKHDKQIEALGERAQAAQQAGDMQATLAIADSIRRLQMAGCEGK